MVTACQIPQPEDLEFQRYANRFRLGQWLYRNCYSLYGPLYNLYKITSDRFALGLFRQHLTEGATVLDIGANIGIITTNLAQMVGPKGCVHAFEPEALNFKRLQNRTQGLPNVTVHRSAIADKSGSRTLYKSSALNVDHRLYDGGTDHFKEKEKVQTLAVDDRFADQRVDLIKLDIQGFEHEALLGMRRTLENNPKLHLYLECWPYGLKRAGSSAKQVLDLLQTAGFTIYIADQQNHRLQAVPYSPEQWQAFETQPRIDFNLWCSREPSAEKSHQ